MDTHRHRQDEHRGDVGENGAAHHHRHRRVRGQAEALDDGECQQRVRSDEGADEQRAVPSIGSQAAEGDPAQKGQQESQRAKGQGAVPRFFELVEVDLEADKEHEEQLPEFREEGDHRSVRIDGAQHIRPQQDAGEDEPQHPGQPQPLHGFR